MGIRVRVILVGVMLSFHVSQELPAQFLRPNYLGVRPTAMGNAYTAVADDNNVLWYNPAGLTQIRGLHFNLFNFLMGADSTQTLSGIKEAVMNGQYSNLLQGQNPEFLRDTVAPSFFMPNFGFALLQNAQGILNIENLTSTGVDIFAANDLGAIAGIGIPVSKYLGFGVAASFVERSGIDVSMTPSQLLAYFSLSESQFMANIYQALTSRMGTGYGFGVHLGALARLPIVDSNNELTFGAAALNVGRTTFTSLGSLPAPPGLPPVYNFGTSLLHYFHARSSLRWSVDIHHNFEVMPFFKQAHLGAEYRFSQFHFDVGLYQAYPTFGCGFHAPHHTEVIFSSYAMELGDKVWEQGLRVYLLQVNIGFSPW